MLVLAEAATLALSSAATPTAVMVIRLSVVIWLSPLFDARHDEAVDELPLEGEEAREERQAHDECAGRDQAPFGIALAAAHEARETERERPMARGIDHHQGPQELVPVRDHADDPERDECRLRQRQQHIAEDLQERAAVDLRGILEVAGNAEEGLA